MSFLDFLRDVGRFSRVNVMLSRDSVKTRLSREEGITFTEQVHLPRSVAPHSLSIPASRIRMGTRMSILENAAPAMSYVPTLSRALGLRRGMSRRHP